MEHIKFKDNTGDILGRPGEFFYKNPGITDEMIQGYLDRGATLVKIDTMAHAAAVNQNAKTALFAATQELAKVPAEFDEESSDVTKRRTRLTHAKNGLQATADEAQRRYDVAALDKKEAVAKKAAKPKTRKKTGK